MRGTFQVFHYAGDVVYDVHGFIDKNNDLLVRDIKETMSVSTNRIVRTVFPKEELMSMKRPVTVLTEFKNSVGALVEILMIKTPWYIRCIKPNHDKQPGIVNEQLVHHQVSEVKCGERNK